MTDNMLKKNRRIISVILLLCMSAAMFCSACGKTDADSAQTTVIEGELPDIITQIYAGLDNLDAETKEAMQNYVYDTLTAENEQALLGVADIPYTEGLYSVPMISSIPYQCVLLRVEPEDVDTVKEQLKANADVNKWVCTSAETVLVENIGDLILFIMSDKDVAYAVSASFQALGK
ncbi:MAG: hypothetical protein NC321_13035 [Clostridium sp.]|nr:hypothetical protein [Clostridium sp.]